ncbi:MKI67 FHA domain-interacting nucleolar phosphoprotein-like [Neodiprion fabricii]|uniref:MKI67 FHA domain-interacting nucleolar phosphoprotein-like n=1 Tax=Neodiprion fabricii TaxID=2872261 RepID=UPI001ED97E5F|nr:MKI67 FHA domain-interacting nucleolar phosphoprotein-like [Neodiprion fabricii]
MKIAKQAADQSDQSTLSKAVKNVKQKLLTKPKKPEAKIPIENSDVPSSTESVSLNRGIVYLGHIPHGFFEEQMISYFKQFGKVTRARVVRSVKTGRSCGYGYIEFMHSEVAKIAAQSMNNYLMSGRLLKATYIPPEKQHGRYFAGRPWSKQQFPRSVKRKEQNMRKNQNVDNSVDSMLAQRKMKKISVMEKKLEQAGIFYKIKPVEVPEDTQVKKRKSSASRPASTGTKKIKTSNGTVASEIDAEDGSLQKVEKKAVVKEPVINKTKKKNKLELKPADEVAEAIKASILAVPKPKKKISTCTVQVPEISLPKKSKKKMAADSVPIKKKKEAVSTELLVGKKLKGKIESIDHPPTAKKLKQQVEVIDHPPTVKKTKQKVQKNIPAAVPLIEKSGQKKISFLVPTVKKSKKQIAAQVSLSKKGKKKGAAA